MRSRHRVALSLLAALVMALAVAPVAQAEEPHRTAIGVQCLVMAAEGTEALQGCEATVEDGSPGPTPPSGVVTFQHSITCTLSPISADSSTCAFTVTTPFGDARLRGEYSGDSTHAPSEIGIEWDVAWVGQEIRSSPIFVPLAYLIAPPKAESTPSEATAPATRHARPPLQPKIAARPAERTHRHLARFRFADGGRFECELDGGPYRPCGSVFRHRVSTGEHVLRVRTVDGGPIASFRWRVLPDN